MRNINGDFPSDSHPHTEHYDYLSDSDLEDDCSEEEDGEPPEGDGRNLQRGLEDAPDSQSSQTIVLDNPLIRPSSVEAREAQDDNRSAPLIAEHLYILTNPNHRPNDNLTRMGKVAIIHDVAAVTCAQCSFSPTDSRTLLASCRFEAMLCFLYAGEIEFASFSSDPHCELPAQARTGDLNTGRLPTPSAKSIYRLADKVTSLAHVWSPLGSSVLVRYTNPQAAS